MRPTERQHATDSRSHHATHALPSGTLRAVVEAVLAEVRRTNARIDALFDKTRVTNDTILTIPELAEQFEVSRRTILRWIKLGMPLVCKAKGIVRIRYGDALAWLNRTGRSQK